MTSFDNNTRIILLARCHAILSADDFLSTAQKQAWIAYRDALQDMDTTIANPIFPTIPDEPTFPLTVQQQSIRAETETNLQNISSQYQAAIDRLVAIETSGAVPFTSAGFNQMVQAVKDEAKYIRLIAQAIKRIITQ